MTSRRMTSRSIRVWARMRAPIAAWIVLSAIVSPRPGGAVGSGPSEAAVPHAAPDRAVEPAGSGSGSDALGTKAPVDPGRATAPAPPNGDGREQAPILYVPPSRGQARHSTGAGTRGLAPTGAAAAPRARVAVLAPSDHVGRTERPSPTLYWHLSAPTTSPIELTIIDDDAIEPLLLLRLPGPINGGLVADRQALLDQVKLAVALR